MTVAIALAAAGTAATWWWWPRAAPAPFIRGADQNVLLITIDTLRADALTLYGGRAASPNLEALARRGLRFDFAHAHAVLTLPSHASILTGLYPYQHGIRDNSGYRLGRDRTTLATLLEHEGFATGAFVGAFPLDSRFGLDNGFAVYDDRFGESHGPLEFSFAERPASAVVQPAREWIARQHGRWFAWVHVFDVHAPYRPPAPFDRNYADAPYYGEAAYVDSAIGPLLDDVGRMTTRPTLVVVTADHGEGLGDHGELTHGLFAYEPTLRVPLVIAQLAAGRSDGPQPLRHSDAPARHVDLLPTVLDALGLAAPHDLPGCSLLPILRGEDAPGCSADSYFEAMSGMLNRGWAPLSGLLAGRQKYVDLPIPELYDLARDPQERENLLSDGAALGRDLARRLAAFRAPLPGGRAVLEPAVESRLRALGYLAIHAPRKPRYTEADDPKRLIDLDREVRRAIELIESGHLAEAEPIYRAVLARRPDMIVAYRHLGYVLWALGRPRDAIAVMRDALAAGTADAGVRGQLASYLAEAGQPREAIALLEPERGRTEDPELLNALGIAYAQAGEPASARAVFTRILQIDQRNAMALQNLGTLDLAANRPADARRSLTQALEIDPSLAAAHTGLGVVELHAGHRAAAIEHWKRAVALDATEFNALYNLATELPRDDRWPEARRYGEQFVRTAPPALFGADIRRVRALLGIE